MTRPERTSAARRLTRGRARYSAQRGRGLMEAETMIAPLPQGERGYSRSRAKICSRRRPDPRHQQSQRALVGVGGELADDGAVAHHDDAVGEGADLVEVDGDEEDRAAGVAQRAQAAMDELDGADIDAARRLPDEEEPRPPRHLARADQLLLVAAGEEGGAQLGVGRPHVVFAHAGEGADMDRVTAQQEPPAV